MCTIELSIYFCPVFWSEYLCPAMIYQNIFIAFPHATHCYMRLHYPLTWWQSYRCSVSFLSKQHITLDSQSNQGQQHWQKNVKKLHVLQTDPSTNPKTIKSKKKYNRGATCHSHPLVWLWMTLWRDMEGFWLHLHLQGSLHLFHSPVYSTH